MICPGKIPQLSPCLDTVPRPSTMTCMDNVPRSSAFLDSVPRPSVMACLDKMTRSSAMTYVEKVLRPSASLDMVHQASAA